ncbi:MAG: glycosyltransferase [Microbacteriaceae bacterium]
MHIAIFLDQHLHSLGGTQVSVGLQRKFLSDAGHLVTLVIPHSSANNVEMPDAHVIELPSLRVTGDGEYVMGWFGKRSEKILEKTLKGLPPVDIVHIQADFTMAMLGHRFAQRHNIPIVQTFHHWLEVGIQNAVAAPKTFLKLISWLQARMLKLERGKKARTSWQYLQNFAERAAAVTAPTEHFAQELIGHGVAPEFVVVPTGIDDELYLSVLDNVAKTPDTAAQHPVPEVIWLGRFAPEKRIMTMLEAITLVPDSARYKLIGTGQLEDRVKKFIAEKKLEDRVSLLGKMPHQDVLEEIARADLMVQTSIGFETQGMTVYESAAFGTPLIMSDSQIAAELPPASFTMVDSPSAEDLAIALNSYLLEHPEPLADKKPFLELRQSELTARMIGVYESVLAAR